MRVHLLSGFFITVCLAGCGGSGPGSSSSTNTPPSISSTSPSSIITGSPATTISVFGANFTSATEVFWNGTELSTTYVNSGEVTAAVPATDLSAAADVQITVSNSGSAAGGSAPVSFLVGNPKPELAAISPMAVTAGDSVTLTVTASYLVPGAQILWNGTPLSTTAVNSTTLTAPVPSSDLTAAATVSVSASNPEPGGGQSTSLPLMIFSGSTRMVGIPLAANDIVWDSTHGLIYASVPGVNGSAGSVQAINPVTAKVIAQVAAGSDPNQLAISSDDSELWVGEDDTGSVERLALPPLTPDLQFNLPMLNANTMQTALSLQTAPGTADTVAMLLTQPGSPLDQSDSTVIYDNATPRPAAISNSNIASLEWGADASTLYGRELGCEPQAVTKCYSLDVMRVDASGLSMATAYPFSFSELDYIPRVQFHFDSSTGYLYTDGGQVINPATGDLAGKFDLSAFAQGGTLDSVDSAQGLVFFAGQTYHQESAGGYTIEAFNKSTYQLLDTLTIPLPDIVPGQLSNYLAGPPTHFLRWGNSGLAFITASGLSYTPMLFLIDGNFVNSTATPDFATGQGVETLPNPTAISPQSVTAGSAALTVTITGTGFNPGAVAYWSPAPPACPPVDTTYVSPTELQAAIPACDLASPGIETITVSNGTSFTLSATQFVFTIVPPGSNPMVMNLAATGLAWDQKSGLLYAAVGSGDPQYPNSIVAINPTTGAVEKSQWVGANPSLVRTSSDGAYLYVGYEDSSSVTRLQLPGLGAPFTWPMGADSATGSILASDVQPAPGASQTVAVAGSDGTVTVFDNGAARANSLTSTASGNIQSSLQWGSDSTVLYGAGRSVSATTLGDLSVMNVNTSGVSLSQNDPGVLRNPNQDSFFGPNIHYDSGTGYLYGDNGAVVDPTSAALEGEYNSWGLVAPDSSLNTVFILGPTYDPQNPTASASWSGGFGLSSYDQKAFAPVGKESLPPMPFSTIGQPVAFVRCGTSCLAFAIGEGPDPNSGSAGVLYILNDPNFVTAAH